MDADFANTDDRAPLEWKSRYEEGARKEIRGEAFYLGAMLFILPALIVALWLDCFRFGMVAEKYSTFCRYGFAWLAGTFGGTMFSIKWLYHAVARAYWNQDRRLWRVFCPHLSGGLSFAFFTVAVSGLVKAIDVATLHKPAAIIACSFLVGYFSDTAIGKLKEIAETLFGTRRESKERITIHNKNTASASKNDDLDSAKHKDETKGSLPKTESGHHKQSAAHKDLKHPGSPSAGN